jgi:hypothetical protein
MLHHPSDHSAVNHCVQVINHLVSSSKFHHELNLFISSALVIDQISSSKVSIKFIYQNILESSDCVAYVSHESLWLYKRLLFLLLLSHAPVAIFSSSLIPGLASIAGQLSVFESFLLVRDL